MNKEIKSLRFAKVGVLNADSKVLGVPVKTWDQHITAGFEKGLTTLKARRMLLQTMSGIEKTAAREKASEVLGNSRTGTVSAPTRKKAQEFSR